TTLFLEFGPSLPLSLMSQYCPVRGLKDISLNRPITQEEFGRAYDHARELGFEHIYVQVPEKNPHGSQVDNDPFLPDFRIENPFSPERVLPPR
ncbi:MAG: hypothetical protein JRH06_11585, partial [Deltaproteobacteria bacterium]|nr:hypothetical protein [Deltaproteobacteria bacterium]